MVTLPAPHLVSHNFVGAATWYNKGSKSLHSSSDTLNNRTPLMHYLQIFNEDS